MRRIKIAGLCLVAVFAISVMASATASAALPEIGRCVKKAKAEGTGYSDSKCTKEGTGTKAKYEWKAGPEAGKEHFTSTGGAGLLETIHGKKVKCSTQGASEGVLNSATEETTKVTFAGCESATFPCTTSPKKSGELETEKLTGTFGYENKLKKKTALKLTPSSGEFFIVFKCLGLTVEVGAKGIKKGGGATAGNGILVPIKNDKMAAVEKLKYNEAKGVQKPTVWEGTPTPTWLESDFGTEAEPGEFEQSGQKITSTITYDTTYELKAF